MTDGPSGILTERATTLSGWKWWNANTAARTRLPVRTIAVRGTLSPVEEDEGAGFGEDVAEEGTIGGELRLRGTTETGEDEAQDEATLD